MSRPEFVAPTVQGAVENWDAGVQDALDDVEALFVGPTPLAQYPLDGIAVANEATMLAALEVAYPAATHARCLVWGVSTDAGSTLYWSNGTVWQALGLP